MHIHIHIGSMAYPLEKTMYRSFPGRIVQCCVEGGGKGYEHTFRTLDNNQLSQGLLNVQMKHHPTICWLVASPPLKNMKVKWDILG